MHHLRTLLALMFCAVSTVSGITRAVHAQAISPGTSLGANWAGYTPWTLDGQGGAYNAALPAYAYAAFNQTQITAQTSAGAALEADIKKALNAGQAIYNVPVNFVNPNTGQNYNNAGVYRAPDGNALVDFSNHSNFTLNAPGITFILKRGSSFFWGAGANFSNVTVQGSDSAPMTVDADDYPSCQGTVQSYNASTGVLTFKLMPGYDAPAASGGLTAYTPQGVVLPNGYYQSVYGAYSGGLAVNAAQGIYQVTADKNGGARYAVGNLLAMSSANGGGANFGYFWGGTATNLTLKDINCGILGPMLAGALGGNANFTRFRNGPLPGTSRLSMASCAQTYGASAVTFDGCEFGNSSDDSLDIQGNGFRMFYQASAANPSLGPNQILAWNVYGGVGFTQGDTISVYANGNFANVLTAHVAAVPQPWADTPGANVMDAANLWNSKGRRGVSVPSGSLVLLTLDQNVTGTTPGDYLEEDSQRMQSFTMTNCYWSNVGMRVMVEGIQQGIFTHNTFEGADGGLALVSDPYWAQGGTCQNVTVSNNVFRNCKVSGNTNAAGALVIGPLWGGGPPQAGQAYAFQNYTVTNNTFTGTGAGGASVSAHMVGSFRLADNVISGGQSTGISLSGCGGGTVFDNSVVRNNGVAVSVDGGSGIDIAQNYLDDPLAPSTPVFVTNSTNVTQEANTTPAMIPVGRTLSLKASANGMYVCADNYGNNPLIASRAAVGQWEQYTVVDAGNGNVGLLAHANTKYVSAAGAGASPLIADQTHLLQWETFQWIALDISGDIGLRSRANGQYVCADLSLANPPRLIADRTAIGQWETYLVTLY